MPKLLKIADAVGVTIGYSYPCPSCGLHHAIYIRPYKHPTTGASWSFSGSEDSPTFEPSVLLQVQFTTDRLPKICHAFVSDGKIYYLADSTHHLAGQTINMEEIEEES